MYFFPCIFLCVHDDCTFISVGTNERPGEAIWIVSLAVSKVSNGLTLCSGFLVRVVSIDSVLVCKNCCVNVVGSTNTL